jgi:divalent metal cation (Fe/Co/Zn/Cd) transporter
MDNFIIAFILLLGVVFISRMINEKANKKLDQAKKAELIDLFSSTRIYSFGVLIVIIILFFLSLRFNLLDPFITYLIYIFLVIAYLIITGLNSFRLLKKNNFPDSFIKSYLISTTIRFLGLIIFFVIMKY